MPRIQIEHRAPECERARGGSTRFDVGIIGGVRFGVMPPHAGGLERHTDLLATALVRRGHDVTVYAGTGEVDPVQTSAYRVQPILDDPYEPSDAARADVSMPPERHIVEHHAYLDLLVRLDGRHDVLHNNSLHHLPVVWPPRDAHVVHTLHTPPTPWLESAYRIRETRSTGRARADRVVSVSRSNAAQWGDTVDEVVHNGIELERFTDGGGGGPALWSGRIVPEKAPHLAIAAARSSGSPIDLAGPIHDAEYFDEAIRPQLSSGVRYLGHLDVDDLAMALGGASCAVVTPAWPEPFGLVVIEALAAGTPVAAFDRGAMSELLDVRTGRLVPFADVEALGQAITTAARLDRSHCRREAARRFSVSAMCDAYCSIYRDLCGGDSVERTNDAARHQHRPTHSTDERPR